MYKIHVLLRNYNNHPKLPALAVEACFRQNNGLQHVCRNLVVSIKFWNDSHQKEGLRTHPKLVAK